MATKAQKEPRDPAKALVIPTPKVLEDALALAGRFRDIAGLQRHVAQRRPLVRGAGAVLALLGLALGAGCFVFLAELRTWLTLPAVFLALIVTVGSLLVLFYVFFSWIEGRALAQALGHRPGPPPGKLQRRVERALRLSLGSAPDVPWLAAILFVLLPFGLIAATAPGVAVLLFLAAVALPLAYARLDAA